MPFLEYSNFKSEGRRQQNKHQRQIEFTPFHPSVDRLFTQKLAGARTEQALKKNLGFLQGASAQPSSPAGHNIWRSYPQAQDR